MISRLKKIWNDQVFSSVIAVGLVIFISTAYNLVLAFIEKTSFKKEFLNFWTLKIELWFVLILLILALTVYFLLKKLKKFHYDKETLKMDRDFFNQIRETHLTEEMMLAPKNNNFSSNPFLGDSLIALFKISDESKKSSFEFINPKLEKRKRRLIDELDNLYDITSKYIFGTSNQDWLSIPSEWEFTDPERMEEAIANISRQEILLSKTYDDLIKTGRRILKV